MNRRLVGVVVALTLAVFAASAWAQASTMKIGFNFFAGGKELDSGKYSIEVTPAGHVVLHTSKGQAIADLTPLKSLGLDAKLQKPKLVFAKIGAVRFLSEVWLPGQEGYQISSSSGEHEEEIVEAK